MPWVQIAKVAIPAIAGYFSSKGSESGKTSVEPFPFSSFLPPEFLAIFDPSFSGYGSIPDTELGRGLQAVMGRIADPGQLPAGLEEMMLGDVAINTSQQQEALARSAAQSGLYFSPSIGQGIERGGALNSAQARLNLATAERAQEAQDMALLQWLTSVYQNTQATRFGQPATTSTAQPGIDPLSGALIAGGSAFSALDEDEPVGTQPTPATPWAGLPVAAPASTPGYPGWHS